MTVSWVGSKEWVSVGVKMAWTGGFDIPSVSSKIVTRTYTINTEHHLPEQSEDFYIFYVVISIIM